MNRRFVNLVVANYRSKMHVLHRLDVSKHLFYPSTAEAEAAHAKEKQESNNGGGGGGKPKPPRIERLRRLPSPITGFESSPTTDPDERRCWDSSPEDMFVLLHGRGGGKPGRILHANGAGHASLYDAGSRTVVSVPDLGHPKGYTPIPFAIAGAGEEGSLYVMSSNGYSFEVLDFGGGGGDGGSSRRRYGFDRRNSLKWQPLPPPPPGADGPFHTSAVLNGGGTICFSSSMYEGTGTSCFDTESRQWWHAGDWTLPFEGRAEHVPELGTWLGFSRDYPHHLCAADLSAIAEAPLDEGPALQHVWEDFNPPPTEETSIVPYKRFPGIVRTTTLEWSVRQLHLVNLGSGRFCVAKDFEAEEKVSLSCCLSDDDDLTTKDRLTVLIGVEVVRGVGGGGLRMIKHKSRRFVFPGNRIKWVL